MGERKIEGGYFVEILKCPFCNTENEIQSNVKNGIGRRCINDKCSGMFYRGHCYLNNQPKPDDANKPERVFSRTMYIGCLKTNNRQSVGQCWDCKHLVDVQIDDARIFCNYRRK